MSAPAAEISFPPLLMSGEERHRQSRRVAKMPAQRATHRLRQRHHRGTMSLGPAVLDGCAGLRAGGAVVEEAMAMLPLACVRRLPECARRAWRRPRWQCTFTWGGEILRINGATCGRVRGDGLAGSDPAAGARLAGCRASTLPLIPEWRNAPGETPDQHLALCRRLRRGRAARLGRRPSPATRCTGSTRWEAGRDTAALHEEWRGLGEGCGRGRHAQNGITGSVPWCG